MRRAYFFSASRMLLAGFAMLAVLLFSAHSNAKPAQNFKLAKLQMLNKVTARVSILEVRPMLTASFGMLDIDVRQCWKSPSDTKPEQAALLEIRERTAQLGQSNLLFSGWMFASAPALSALEHPVYDVTLIACQ